MINFFLKTSSILLVSFVFIACGNKAGDKTSAPSINDNSIHIKDSKIDYITIEPSKLLLQIKAHNHLEEYDLANDKLMYLMTDYPNSLDGVDLQSLKVSINDKLLVNDNNNTTVESNQINFNNLRIETVANTSYYFDESSPEFDTKECFYTYIKKNNQGAKLYLKIRYIDDDWLNIDSYIVSIDGVDYTLYGTVASEEIVGKKKYIVELLDKEISSEDDFNLLNAIANGKLIRAVYVGKSTYKVRDISAQQISAIKNVLEVFNSSSVN